MKYKYKNIKHAILHGIEPGKEKVFNHKINGGGIELIETINTEKEKKEKIKVKTKNKNIKEMI